MRRRLFGWLALAALVSAALTTVVSLVLADRAAGRQVLRNLDRQADVAVLAVSDTPPRSRLRVFDPGGRRRGPLVRRAILADGGAQGRVTVAGRQLAFVRRDTPSGPIAVVRAARAGPADVAPVGRILLLAGLAAALVAAALAVPVAGRLVRPLRELEAATGPVAAHEPGVRVPVQGDDEVAALGRAFNAMADELERARGAERTFLLAVGHELRTPLTAVKGYAEALQDGAVAPAEAGHTIGAEAARLDRLIGDLLELAELGSREFAVAAEPVDLGAVAAAAAERHAAAARAAGIELRRTGAGSATADGERLLQAVSNLVENALRVTPPGGRVTVTAGDGRIEVADTGPGLAPDDLERAFERFRLHRRADPAYRGGSGLGLAIVRELAVAMGGRATARPRAGGGAVFAIEGLSGGAAAPSR